MSAKRQSLTNEESYESLQALFLSICNGEQVEPDAIWRQILADPWFCAEVRVQAMRLVGRRHLDEGWCDDITQEVVVQLQRKLSRRCDLGADAAQIRGHFPGWMGKVIKNACIDSLKRQAPHAQVAGTINPAIDKTWQNDLELDLLAAALTLKDTEKRVVLLNLQGYTIKATAEALGLTPWKVQDALTKAKRQLAKALTPYADYLRKREDKGER